MNYRKAARGAPCMSCGHVGDDVVLAHYSGLRQHEFGKGRGIKGDDFFAAPQCAKCHGNGPFTEGWMEHSSLTQIVDSPPGIRKFLLKLEKSEEQLLQILKWHKSLEEQE